ncbi:hypothetical protein PoB_003167300 [Plakobranchus ocellatus]|uniref:Uncharacterized protein n=1 Tax=Plakobranchus ocellatus TaxID=259542 RepID=A0AAV4AD26_9GAST|nr:hypothetical protein PoB_003167300 [Plakobranchus ocellatus]
MSQRTSLKRKADCELAPPSLKRAKMTPSQEPQFKSCLKKARRRGAGKNLPKKKVRFQLPVQATVAYRCLKKVYEIKRGVQSFLEKVFKPWTAGRDYQSNAGGSRDRAKRLRVDSRFCRDGPGRQTLQELKSISRRRTRSQKQYRPGKAPQARKARRREAP